MVKKKTKKGKKITEKRKPKAKPKAKVKAPPEKKAERPKKVEVTPSLRRTWLRVRKAWTMSFEAFSNTVSLLKDDEANELYDVVRLSLFKDSYAEMLREHPQLREILRSDEDRLCMHDIYDVLSWKLDRRERMPKDRRISHRMKGRIGREAPVFE